MNDSASQEDPRTCGLSDTPGGIGGPDAPSVPDGNTPIVVSPPLTAPHELVHTPFVTQTRKDAVRDLKRELDTVNRHAARLVNAIRALEILDGLEPEKTEKGKSKAGTLAGMNYPDAAKSLMEKSNKRSHSVRDLLDAMAQQGNPVATTKPYRTLYKVLRSRDDIFENDGTGKWRLKAK